MKPRLIDPAIVRRTFASTPSKPCVLTSDGLVYDNVRYRFNREGVKTALSSNLHRMPFANRLKGTARLIVAIRCWDDNIDMIEVYDEANGVYHEMWSTDPGYTGGLSRWEHHAYQKLLRQGGAGATTKRDRLRSKAKHLDKMHKTLTGKSFREREHDFGLLEAEERRQSGARAANPDCARVPELGLATGIGGLDRKDIPIPPFQGKAADTPEGQEEDDLRSDPTAKIAEETGQPEIEELSVPRSRWDIADSVAEDEDNDENDEDK